MTAATGQETGPLHRHHDSVVEDAQRAREKEGDWERGTPASSWKVEALVRGTPKDPGHHPTNDDEKGSPAH